MVPTTPRPIMRTFIFDSKLRLSFDSQWYLDVFGNNLSVVLLHDILQVMSASERVRIQSVEVLSDDWYVLKKTTFEYLRRDGTWQTLSRETYDRGNGAVVLLYNRENRTVVLTRQFRYPACWITTLPMHASSARRRKRRGFGSGIRSASLRPT